MPEIRTLKAVSGQGIRIARVSSGSLRMAAVKTAVINWEGDPYDGQYSVTPSQETQVLETRGKVTLQNIVINPIPSNYGLVTWNGSNLMIS